MELAALLAREESLNPWAASVQGIPLWAGLRTHLLRQALYADQPQHQLAALEKPRLRFFAPPIWKYYLRSLKNVLLPRDYAALIYKGSVTRIAEDGGRRSRDRLYSPFYEALGDPLLIEAFTFTRQMPPPDPLVERYIISNDWLSLLLRSEAALRRLPPAHQRELDAFAEAAVQHFEQPAQFEQARRMLHRFVVGSQFFRRLVGRVIAPRLRRPLALVNTASYMGGVAALTLALHEAGITVVELQHGVLEVPYKFPASLLADVPPAVPAVLPDLLLTFGDYWSAQVQAPYQVEALGYPYLQEMVQRLEAHHPANPQQVLVVSQPLVTEALVTLACNLADALPQYQFSFRPHPREVLSAPLRQKLAAAPNLRLRESGSPYEMIAESGIVLGYSSMLLFEVAAFSGKRILIMDNALVPDRLGEKFRTAEQAVNAIQDATRGQMQLAREALWAAQPMEKLAAFLQRYA